MGINHGFYYGPIHFCIYMISVELVIALDFPYNFIQEKYQGYLECKRMCKLVQIYEEARYLHGLLRLYKIVKDLTTTI